MTVIQSRSRFVVVALAVVLLGGMVRECRAGSRVQQRRAMRHRPQQACLCLPTTNPSNQELPNCAATAPLSYEFFVFRKRDDGVVLFDSVHDVESSASARVGELNRLTPPLPLESHRSAFCKRFAKSDTSP